METKEADLHASLGVNIVDCFQFLQSGLTQQRHAVFIEHFKDVQYPLYIQI